MGGSASTNLELPVQDKSGKSRNVSELTDVLMPIYYVDEPISEYEKDKAIKSWKMIATGQAPEFYRLKKADPENVTCLTPMEFFGDRFIQRLFEVHPIAAPMFSKSSMKQGTLFFRMIAFTIAALDNDGKFDSQFVALAKSHNRMGIRAVEYGIFGECLFWVLKLTLGPEYDAVTHMGWVKIFSRVLRSMIPVAIEYEIDNKESVKNRVASRFQALTKTIDQPSTIRAERTPSADDTTVIASQIESDRMMSIIPN
eukprot:gene16116-biopygen7249